MNWPVQHPRTPGAKRRNDRPYVKDGWSRTYSAVVAALNRLAREADKPVRLLDLSTGHDPRHIGATGHPLAHAPDPQDPGVVAWVDIDGKSLAIPCDGYNDPIQNARALVNYFQQMARTARDHVGTVEALFQGFAALPATASVVAVGEPPAVQEYRARVARGEDPQKAYRACALLAHPDRGGTGDDMAALNQAHAAVTP